MTENNGKAEQGAEQGAEQKAEQEAEQGALIEEAGRRIEVL